MKNFLCLLLAFFLVGCEQPADTNEKRKQRYETAITPKKLCIDGVTYFLFGGAGINNQTVTVALGKDSKIISCKD